MNRSRRRLGLLITGMLLAGILLTLFVTGCGGLEEVQISDTTKNAVSEKSSSEAATGLSSDIRIEASTAFSSLAESILEDTIGPSEQSGYTVTSVATTDGFSDISSGKIDVLIASIPNEQQFQMIEASGKEIESIPITREPLVILVNKDNPVDSLSLEQLQDLYLNDAENWSAYGGKDSPVTSYQLTEGNGSQTAFSQYVKGTQISENHREIATMNKIIDAVGDDCSGICYAFASYYFGMYSGNNTKVLKIDGKCCDAPDYPLTCEISLFFNKDNRSPDVQKILAYLKQ